MAPGRDRGFDRLADAWMLEELRQALRRELRTHGGQAAVARSIGVSRSVVRKFLEMRSVPEPRHLDRLRDWAADRPYAETPLPVVSLAVLVDGLPAGARHRARRELAGCLACIYQQSGEEVPAWLALEVEDRRRHP
ncbi:MAG TPA: hypothetical protein VGR37_24785 [Longimicrobiaceae bacterium]|nr:hypothetical protein [Longimicrobiaceae bacterium]